MVFREVPKVYSFHNLRQVFRGAQKEQLTWHP